ncbi:hypothetical protein Tco_0600925 [Tanacetum coccineum]
MHDSKTFNNVFYALKEDLIYATEFKIQEMASTDVSKITRKQSKTGKHGHGNQKSTKRSQRIKAKAKKSKTPATSTMVKAQVYVGFVLDSLLKEAQAVTSRNDSLAILECTQIDQTAINHLAMIRRFKG